MVFFHQKNTSRTLEHIFTLATLIKKLPEITFQNLLYIVQNILYIVNLLLFIVNLLLFIVNLLLSLDV